MHSNLLNFSALSSWNRISCEQPLSNLVLSTILLLFLTAKWWLSLWWLSHTLRYSSFSLLLLSVCSPWMVPIFPLVAPFCLHVLCSLSPTFALRWVLETSLLPLTSPFEFHDINTRLSAQVPAIHVFSLHLEALYWISRHRHCYS